MHPREDFSVAHLTDTGLASDSGARVEGGGRGVVEVEGKGSDECGEMPHRGVTEMGEVEEAAAAAGGEEDLLFEGKVAVREEAVEEEGIEHHNM